MEKISKFEIGSEKMYSEIKRLEFDLEKLTIQNNAYLKKNICLKEEIFVLKSNGKNLKKENIQQRKHIEFKENQLKSHLRMHKNKILFLKTSYSFRIGQLIIESFSKLGKNTMVFPIRFGKLLFEFFFLR